MKHVTSEEVVEQEKDRHKWECRIHEKSLKMVPLPAAAVIPAAEVGNDVKTSEPLWENCTLKLKIMTKIK